MWIFPSQRKCQNINQKQMDLASEFSTGSRRICPNDDGHGWSEVAQVRFIQHLSRWSVIRWHVTGNLHWFQTVISNSEIVTYLSSLSTGSRGICPNDDGRGSSIWNMDDPTFRRNSRPANFFSLHFLVSRVNTNYACLSCWLNVWIYANLWNVILLTKWRLLRRASCCWVEREVFLAFWIASFLNYIRTNRTYRIELLCRQSTHSGRCSKQRGTEIFKSRSWAQCLILFY